MCCQKKYLHLLLILNSAFADYVPVFMWSKNVNLEAAAVPALWKVSEESFKKIVSDCLQYSGTTQVMGFAEQSLSPEDFINQRKSLNKLKQGENRVVYISSVENPIKVIKKLSVSGVDIFLNDLNDTAGDRIMPPFSYNDILAIYTGYSASVLPLYKRKSRYLLRTNETTDTNATSNATGLVFRGHEVLLHLTSPGIYTSDKGKKQITVDGSFSLTSTVSENSTEMNVTLVKENLTITFNISKKINGYWYITSIILNEGNESFLTNTDSSIHAPLGFSYHCGSFNASDEKNEVSLHLPGFQLQPFIQNDTFQNVYHCVGFFTIGILNGIIVCGLLLTVFFIGVTPVMNLKTIDRFENPKGKTIAIRTED